MARGGSGEPSKYPMPQTYLDTWDKDELKKEIESVIAMPLVSALFMGHIVNLDRMGKNKMDKKVL